MRSVTLSIVASTWSALYPREWAHAVQETLQLELGSKGAAVLIDERLRQITKRAFHFLMEAYPALAK